MNDHDSSYNEETNLEKIYGKKPYLSPKNNHNQKPIPEPEQIIKPYKNRDEENKHFPEFYTAIKFFNTEFSNSKMVKKYFEKNKGYGRKGKEIENRYLPHYLGRCKSLNPL